jgi:hypothetical protein
MLILALMGITRQLLVHDPTFSSWRKPYLVLHPRGEHGRNGCAKT